MKKRYNELNEDELRTVFADIESGEIDAGKFTEDVFVEADPSTSFATLRQVEKEKFLGTDPKVIFVGKARKCLVMSKIYAELARSEDRESPFTQDQVSGIWSTEKTNHH